MTTAATGRRTLVLGGLAALAGCGLSQPTLRPSTPAPATTGSVTAGAKPGWRTRAMTYNMLTSIRTGADFKPGVNLDEVKLAARAPVMARWIAAADPDIIGLQENEANRSSELPLRALIPLLPGYQQVHPDLEVPILVREAMYKVGAVGSKEISQGPYVRYLSWCRLTHNETGREILVANTHLDPFQRPEQARARSAEIGLVIAELRRLNPGWATPTLLLGDLNTRSDETRAGYRDALVKLRRAGLRNAATVAKKDASEVMNAASKSDFGAVVDGRWRYRAIRTDGLCYDYAFVSGQFQVRSWQVVTGPGIRRIGGHPYFADGPVPSDHCPVQVELGIAAG